MIAPAPGIAKSCRYGTHRVIEPAGALPQAAWRLDNTPAARENEILCAVDALSIDSASFRQLREAAHDDPRKVGEAIMETVATRGKQHNPITGSGGMFVGRVLDVGSQLANACEVQIGDRLASLVSLTLTPLHLERIRSIDLNTARVDVEGRAILFACAHFARLPDDIPTSVALAVLDVAGAPAQVRRLAHTGSTVVVIGADGKSGLLACAQAKARVGSIGRVIGIAPDAQSRGAQLLRSLDLVDDFIEADARYAGTLLEILPERIPGLADLVVNCVNVPGTEQASILCARDEGTVYFFSMCTSFTAAALGAEGVGKDVTMIVGNGFTKGHAELALDTLRANRPLLDYFTETYGKPA
jgi:L-erythro-3,5-diaminohexanoate dehydrogenase